MTVMRATLVIARHEIATQRNLLLAGGALGLLVLLVAVWEREHPQVLALALGLAFGGCTALFLGGSAVVREARADTLSLYLGMPMSEASLWWGKLLGSSALAILGQLLVGLPALLIFAGQLDVTHDLNRVYALSFLAILPLVALAHCVGSWLRSEPALLLIDLAALALLAVGVLVGYAWLTEVSADRGAMILGGLIVLVFVTASLFAGRHQLVHGRCDERRSRLALSRAVWLPVLTVAAVALIAARWTSSVTPDDIDHVYMLRTEGKSPWITYGGVVLDKRASLRQGVRAGFLHNVDSGEWRRLPSRWRGVRLAPNGASAVRLQDAENGLRLVTYDLASGAVAHDVAWPVTEPVASAWSAVSPNLEHLALVADRTRLVRHLVVAELATGELRADLNLSKLVGDEHRRIETQTAFDGVWTSDGSLRLFGVSSDNYRVFDVRLDDDRARVEPVFVTAAAPGLAIQRAIRDRSHQHHLLHSVSVERSSLAMLDQSGESLWSFELDDSGRSGIAVVGASAVVSRRVSAESSEIELIRNGEVTRSWAIDHERISLGPVDPQQRVLLVASDRGPEAGHRRRLFLLDPELDEMTVIDDVALPQEASPTPYPFTQIGPYRQPQTDETLGLLWSDFGALWTLDLEKRTTRRVL